MKTAKLLGYYTTSWHEDANPKEYGDHDTGDTTYHFIIDLNGVLYEFTAVDSYGSCGSGYCSASWGYINPELIKIEQKSDLIHKTTVKEIYVTILDELVATIEKVAKYSYDATETFVMSTDNEAIVSGTGNGGCGYYPSGGITLNEELFK